MVGAPDTKRALIKNDNFIKTIISVIEVVSGTILSILSTIGVFGLDLGLSVGILILIESLTGLIRIRLAETVIIKSRKL